MSSGIFHKTKPEIEIIAPPLENLACCAGRALQKWDCHAYTAVGPTPLHKNIQNSTFCAAGAVGQKLPPTQWFLYLPSNQA